MESFALLDLRAGAIALQNLLLVVIMLTESSHQVVPPWNRIFHSLVPFVLYDCVLAGVCNIAFLMATTE